MSRATAIAKPSTMLLELHLRSASFTGEWPVGVHWQPGEERVIPASYPRVGDPPAGLEPVKPTEPQEGAAGEG